MTWHKTARSRKAAYHYKECGLDDVFLVSGYTVVPTAYGDAVSIMDQDGLHATIARHLIESKKMLSGKELRFLRKRMDCTQSAVARMMGVDAQTVARWEKGETKVSGPADRMMRVIYNDFASDPVAVTEMLEALDSIDEPVGIRQLFESTPEGWKAAA